MHRVTSTPTDQRTGRPGLVRPGLSLRRGRRVGNHRPGRRHRARPVVPVGAHHRGLPRDCCRGRTGTGGDGHPSVVCVPGAPPGARLEGRPDGAAVLSVPAALLRGGGGERGERDDRGHPRVRSRPAPGGRERTSRAPPSPRRSSHGGHRCARTPAGQHHRERRRTRNDFPDGACWRLWVPERHTHWPPSWGAH